MVAKTWDIRMLQGILLGVLVAWEPPPATCVAKVPKLGGSTAYSGRGNGRGFVPGLNRWLPEHLVLGSMWFP